MVPIPVWLWIFWYPLIPLRAADNWGKSIPIEPNALLPSFGGAKPGGRMTNTVYIRPIYIDESSVEGSETLSAAGHDENGVEGSGADNRLQTKVDFLLITKMNCFAAPSASVKENEDDQYINLVVHPDDDEDDDVQNGEDQEGLLGNTRLQSIKPRGTARCWTVCLALIRQVNKSNLLLNNEGILNINGFGSVSDFNPRDRFWYRAPELLLHGATDNDDVDTIISDM
ncbi:hypothetical protein BVC80_949g48 [Macleaya cordata]|uniref:Protein kinase domain n=1 Tax=Macleaya cordata TaxID=56857 RepID=A0A200QX34_MACCD|nr:hypothetical protein BVC80_949g48 [Macleaya cordata]